MRIAFLIHRWVLGLLLVSATVFGKEFTVACVDCYSSASLYPAAFARLFPEHKARWIFVQTHEYDAGQKSYAAFFPQDTIFIRYDGTEKGWEIAAAQDLKRLGVTHLLGGMDEGSFQSPLLAHELKLKSNPLRSRELRKRKDLQMSAVGRFGIPTRKLEPLSEALLWIKNLRQKEIVVKFNDGVSGFKMETFFRDDPELEEKLATKLATDHTGPFGKEDYLIVQPRILGKKFFFNTFTFENQQVTTGVSEYFMLDTDQTTLYFVDPFLDSTSTRSLQLETAAKFVNERLEVEYGPAHVEFIVEDDTDDIFLLENNVRLAGVGVPEMERAVYGTSQLDLQLLAEFSPETLPFELAKFPRKRQTDGLILVMPSVVSGVLSKSGVDLVESLPTFFSPGPQYKLTPGKAIVPTVDQNTAMALIHLVGHSSLITKDLERMVSAFESNSLVHIPGSVTTTCASEIANTAKKMRTIITSDLSF